MWKFRTPIDSLQLCGDFEHKFRRGALIYAWYDRPKLEKSIFPLIFRRHLCLLTTFCATKWTLKPINMMRNTLWKMLTWFFHMDLWFVITAVFYIFGRDVGSSCARDERNLRLDFFESHMICQHMKIVKFFGACMCKKPPQDPRL